MRIVEFLYNNKCGHFFPKWNKDTLSIYTSLISANLQQNLRHLIRKKLFYFFLKIFVLVDFILILLHFPLAHKFCSSNLLQHVAEYQQCYLSAFQTFLNCTITLCCKCPSYLGTLGPQKLPPSELRLTWATYFVIAYPLSPFPLYLVRCGLVNIRK